MFRLISDASPPRASVRVSRRSRTRMLPLKVNTWKTPMRAAALRLRHAAGVVGQPDQHAGAPRVEDPAENVGFVADGLEGTELGLDLLAVLGLHLGAHRLLAVANW